MAIFLSDLLADGTIDLLAPQANAFAGFTDQTGRAIRFRSTSTLGKENIDLILDYGSVFIL